MRIVLVLFFLLVNFSLLQAQKLPDKSRRIVYDSLYVYTFHVIDLDSNHRTFDENKRYYWYDYNSIHFNYYGKDGLILNGGYKKSYQANNKLVERGSFRYGEKHGIWKYWFENGNLRKIISWENGMLWGEYKAFSKSGKLLVSGKYRKNKKEGVWKTFSSNNNVIVETWSKGKLNGLYKEIQNDKIVLKGHYKGGLKTGIWIDYRSNKTEKYEQGKLVPYEKKNFWSKLFKKKKKS